ncbi:serine hydrolase [Cellulomonas sp. APG4]|uniref:Cpe/LpqF family protein n=1 Tax=Cellulomonas sp. APG4 TaxID=1538656 RepID=UPI0013798EA9|nr:serine hydrolase [Cellulomonas sp. APG4]
MTVHRGVAARVAAGMLAAAVLLGACTGAGGDAPSPSATPTVEPTQPAVVELPDSPAGEQARWVLEQLDAPAGSGLPEVEERFSAELLAQVPSDELVAVVEQLRPLAPWTVTGVEAGPDALVAQIGGQGQDLEMQLAVDEAGLIAGLFFGEAAPAREPAADAAALLDEVAGLPGSSLLVAEVLDGACVPVEGLVGGSSAGAELPVGSIAKLWVLGAVVDAIAAGTLAWEDEVTVTDALRSLPSGELQDAEAGTTLTVREAAQKMIEISDNTATDLLIDAVGREAVERAMVDMGHADPGINIPFASTRELFHLGWGDPTLRERWSGADEAGRRALLAELPPGPPEIDPAAMSLVAAWPDGVDWFATAADVCAAHAALAERAQTPAGEPLTEILTANPGVTPDDAWSSIAYKGGSSVGTMAGSWYAVPAGDGPPVVVVLQTAARSANDAVAARTMVGIAEDALRLAAP